MRAYRPSRARAAYSDVSRARRRRRRDCHSDDTFFNTLSRIQGSHYSFNVTLTTLYDDDNDDDAVVRNDFSGRWETRFVAHVSRRLRRRVLRVSRGRGAAVPARARQRVDPEARIPSRADTDGNTRREDVHRAHAV